MKALTFLLAVLVLGGGYLYWTHLPAPAPAPRQPRHAAGGLYYPLHYLSAFTKTGVVGFPPGQQLRLVEMHGDTKWLMTDGHFSMEVDPADLTNDLDVAAGVANSDASAQAALASQQSRDDTAAQQRALSVLMTPTPAPMRASRHSSRRPASGNPLDAPATAVNGGRAVTGQTTYIDKYGNTFH